MKLYKNIDTNEIWTLEEIKDSYESVKYEISDEPEEFEDYLDDLLQKGYAGQGGLVETNIFVADKQTGTFIDRISSIEEGIEKIKEFENSDKAEGIFEEDFYDIVDENHCHVEW